MTTRFITSVLCGLLFIACDAAPAPQADTVAVAVAHAPSDAGEAFVADTRYVYDVDWSVAVASDNTALPGATSLAGGLALAGTLELVRVGAVDEGALVEARWLGLERATIDMMGAQVDIDRGELLEHRAWIVVPRDGEIHRVLFAPDSGPLFRQSMTSLVGHVDLGDRRIVRRVVPAGHGLAEAEYVADPEVTGRVVRRLARYVRFDAFATDGDPPMPTGEATIERDHVGALVAIDTHESVAGESDGLRHADDRFSLKLREAVAAPSRPTPELATLVEHDPTDAPDERSIERALSERFARGLTTDDIAMGVDGVDNGLMPRNTLVVRATGLLRARPEVAQTLAPMFMAAESGHAQAFVLDLLASAGTSEAQSVMRTLLADPVTAASPDYDTFVQRFALLRDPDPRTAEQVLAGFDDAMATGNDTAAGAFAYPLGAVCGQLERDPMLAELLHDRLLETLATARRPALRTAVLAGLGNAARKGDAAIVLRHLDDADPEVRMAAVGALRFMDAPTSRAALTAMLGDRERMVAQRALGILEQYVVFEREAPTLAAAASLAMHHPDISDALALSLLPRREDEGVRAGLHALVDRVTPDTRRRILATLQ